LRLSHKIESESELLDLAAWLVQEGTKVLRSTANSERAAQVNLTLVPQFKRRVQLYSFSLLIAANNLARL
jgi:hypothetical protein